MPTHEQYIRNKERYDKQNKEWKTKNRERVRAWERTHYHNKRLRYYYGLDKEDFDKIFKFQNGKCAVCGSSDPNRKGNTTLSVDHDNKTDVVRGLLCSKCNLGLGLFNHDVYLLLSAIDYLNNENYMMECFGREWKKPIKNKGRKRKDAC